MLDIRKVLAAKPKEHVESKLKTLFTPWGEELDPSSVLEEHPDPQFEREEYQVLNGEWQCAFVEGSHQPDDDLLKVVSMAEPPAVEGFNQRIMVPFSPEAPLSGVGRQLQSTELLWYRRTFPMPDLSRGKRCLVHFQAVDYACSCWVNGNMVATHVGGYTPFTVDVTDEIEPGENELLVCVADPSEHGVQLRGKQRFDRGDIWYTAQSGIWQTVWAEVVPASYVREIKIEPDAETGVLAIGARCVLGDGEHPSTLSLDVLDARGIVVAWGACEAEPTCALAVRVARVRPWSPDDPYLYTLRLRFGDDVVKSYCAFRTVEMGHDASGHRCVLLNGKPMFLKGVLDQAYWSDGLMTAPDDQALIFDIEAMRDAGFNLMRKHIKLESPRWYYHCDRLGMLVLQDMVNGGARDLNLWNYSYKPTLFKVSWNHFEDRSAGHMQKLGAESQAYRDEWVATARQTVELLGNHPCIIGWSLFNEGWGQFDARTACKMVRNLDSTRVVDAVSGWYDQGCGDFYSVHNYFRDLSVWRCRFGRAFFISEFGGFSHRVEGHSSLDECYGYEVYEERAEWREAVRDVLARVDALEGKGLAGYVYTQVSDIEEETNGILTYDRKVNKLRDA